MVIGITVITVLVFTLMFNYGAHKNDREENKDE